MAPQGVQSILNSSSSYRPEVEEAIQYGNGMEQAARKFQVIILAAWAVNTGLIFTHRLLDRENPVSIEFMGETIWKQDWNLTDRQAWIVEHIDAILFVISYTLLSFLMALQFYPYGQVTTQ